MTHITITCRHYDGDIELASDRYATRRRIGTIVQVKKDLFEARVTDKSVHGINLVQASTVREVADQIVMKAQRNQIFVVPDIGIDDGQEGERFRAS